MTEREKTARAAKVIRNRQVTGLTTLKARRLALGLSQKATADRIGVCVATYQQWEACRFFPNALQLPAIALVFGCEIIDLYLPPEAMEP